ncbi:MAG: A24 family peptidase [Eubacterium sp.]|nr:A24 family peptidase [Eubacterium sp.]
MVVAIVLAVLGFISYIFLNVVIRRMVAVVRSREDYDEDVDGKMTDAEKKAFEETKEIEAGKIKIGFADVKAEYKTRFFITAIIGAVLGALVGFFFGLSVETIIYFIFFGVLTVIAFIDMDTMEIPPSLNLIILGLGIISLILNLIGVQKSDVSIIDRLIGAVCVSGFLLIVTILVKGAFGGGDIKLMAAAGVLLGWKGVLTGFLIGLFIGAAIGIVLIARRKKGGKEHMPFGPSLCIGLVLAVLFGQQLVNWYIDLLKSMMPNTYGY